MPIFDKELGNTSIKTDDIKLPEPILASPTQTTVNTNLGGFGEGKSGKTGLTLDELGDFTRTPNDSSTFNSPFQAVTQKELLDNKRYPLYARNMDLENVYGLQQSWTDQLANGVIKMGATGLGTFAQSFATIPNTVSAIRSQEMSKLSGNPEGYEGAIDNWLKNIEDIFPNYYTRYEKEHPFLAAIPGFAGSGNFWGDKFIKNLGFTAGAIAGAVVQDAAIGLVTEGIGVIPLIGNQVGRAALALNKLFTGTNDLEKALMLAKGASMEARLGIKGLEQMAAFTKVTDGFKYAAALYGSARTEAAVEARDGYRQLKEELTRQYKLDNLGEEPTGIAATEIDNYATAAMNARFGANMAILTVSNAIQFDNLFKSFSKAEKGFTSELTKSIEDAGKIGLKEGSLDVFERKVSTGIKDRLWEAVRPKVANVFSEGVYEEGGQYAVEKGTYDYYTRKYKDPKRKENIENWNSLNEVVDSTLKGLGEQFGTTEGLENMFIGGLTGILTGAGMSKLDSMRGQGKDKRLETSLNIANRYGITGVLGDKYDNTVQSAAIAKEMQEAAKSGDVFRYKNAKHDLFFAAVQSRIPAGMHDVTIAQFEMLKDLPKDQFEKTFGMDFTDSNKATVVEYMDAMIAKANQIEKVTKSLNNTFKNPFKPTLDPKTDAEKLANKNYNTFEQFKTELAWAASIAPDVDERLNSIQQDVNKINPLVTNELLSTLTDADTLKELAASYEEKATQLNQTITEQTSKADKKAITEEVKTLRTASEKINLQLKNNQINLDTFNYLLNFELNNQDTKADKVIGGEWTNDLFTYSRDINNLKGLKKATAEIYDTLATKEGFDKFFKQADDADAEQQELADDASVEDMITEPTGTMYINELGQEEEIDVNREYEVAPFKRSKVDKIDEDRWQVSDPSGNLTYYKTEEEAKEAAEEIDGDLVSLGKVKVLAINEDDTVKVEDLDGNIQNIPVEKLEGYEKIQTRQEKLLKFAEDVKNFNADLENTSGQVGTETEEPGVFEDKKKATNIMFLATKTESEDWDDTSKSSAHIVRSREFLNAANFFENRSKLNVVLVTLANEEALGLKGLAATSYNLDPNVELTADQQKQLGDINYGFLAQVFVNENGKYIDKNGKEITEGNVLDQVIFQTMPTIETEGINKEGNKYPLYRSGEKKAAEDQQAGYKTFRAQIFAKDAIPQYYKFDISNGIPVELTIDGVKEKNNVGETLLPEGQGEELISTQKGLVEVSINGTIEHKGKTYNVPKGRPVFKYGDTLASLYNDKLTADQAETVYEILKLASQNISDLTKIKPQMMYLQNILFYSNPKGKTSIQNQIYIDPNTMDLYIGKEGKFDISDVENNKDEIMNALSSIYTNVNNDSLTKNFNSNFREFYVQEGKLEYRSWDNYQTYLLSAQYPDGSNRSISGTPLHTRIAKKSDAVPYNFKQKYSILSATLEIPVTPVKPAAAPRATVLPVAANSIGKFSGNPTDINTTATKEETISFKLDGKVYRATGGKGGLIIIKDAEYNKLVDRVGEETAEQYPYHVVDQELANETPVAPVVPAAPVVSDIEAKINSANSIVEEIVNRGEAEKVFKPITKEDRNLVVDYDSLFRELGKIMSGEKGNKEKEANDLLKKVLKEIHPDKFQNEDEKVIANIFSVAVIQVGKKGEVDKVNELYNAYKNLTGSENVTPTAPIVPTQPGQPSRFAGTIRDEDKYRVDMGDKGPKITEADLTFFKEWHAKNAANFPYEVLEGMINIPGGKKAFGVYVDGVAKFFKGGLKGTQYHEIFHSIFTNAVTVTDQDALFAEMRTRRGMYKDRLSGKTITFAEATDAQLEDKLADEFAGFMAGRVPVKTLGDAIARAFRYIMDVVKKFLNLFKDASKIDTLFEAINKGEYKDATLVDSGISNIPKYRAVDGLTDQETHDFVQDMTIWAGNFLFGEDLENLYDFQKITGKELFAKIENEYLKDGKRQLLGDAAWEDVIQRTKEQLRVLVGLKFNDEDVAEVADDNSNNREYERDPFTIGRKDMSYGMKLLLGTLPKTTNEQVAPGRLPKRQMTDINGYKLLNFGAAFATLINKLSNTTGRDEIVNKLIDLATYDKDYVRLVTHLGGTIDINTGEMSIDFSKFNNNQWRLWVDFTQTFTKQNPDVKVQYVNGNETYLGAANLYTATENLLEGWVRNIRALAKEPGALIKFNRDTKNYEADNQAFKNTPIETIEDKINFLNKIGVDITMPAFLKLTDEQQSTVRKEANDLYTYLQSVKELASLTGKTLNVKGRLKTIAEVIVRATNPIQDNTYKGMDGKTRQAFAQNNALSLFANAFNQSNTLEELLEARPELKDVFATNSIILKKGGPFWDKNGKKLKGINLTVGLAGGTLDEVKDKGKATTKLNKGPRFTQELNFNLDGIYYVINAGDSASEWTIATGNPIAFEDVQGGAIGVNEINKVFIGYLKDDVALALDAKNRKQLKNVGSKAKELRFFKDILSPRMLGAINLMIKRQATQEQIDNFIERNIDTINTSIQNYLKEQVGELKATLTNQSQLLMVDTNVYRYNGLQDVFAKENGLNKNKLSEDDVTNLLTYIVANKNIALIEMHKVLFGDPYQFAIKAKGGKVILDETKRIKSFESPAETSFDDVDFNNYYNREGNKTGLIGEADRIALSKTDPGYTMFKEYLNTVTIKDAEVVGRLLGLTNEADAASIMKDTMYKQVKLRDKAWTKEADLWHNWQMAYTRNKLAAKNLYEYKNKSLQAHDAKLISKPAPAFVIEILKPIVRGNKYGANSINLVLDKFSQMPLYFSMVEGTQLEDVYVKMWKEDVDYIITESGRKVGAEGLHSLYEGGAINKEPFNNNVKVAWTTYGIQVQNQYDAKGGEGTSGSQATKMVSINLFENGKPNTKDPKRAEAIQAAYDRNLRDKKRLLNNGYQRFLNKIGVRDTGFGFEVVDRERLAESLEYEMLRREVSDNVKDIVRLDANGQFIVPFEATFAYKQIQDIVYSMVDKSIVRPKVSGGSYVQAPVTGWEKGNRKLAIKTKEGYKQITTEQYNQLGEEMKKKVVLTDDTLKFYTKESPYCEIMLPYWFKQQLGKSKRFNSDEAILKYLNSTEEGKSILKGIGFRIPTQALSSMEVFVVKGFLPQSMGKTVVVPSEITTKAGSDFDIDKLNVYLKAIYKDKDGDLRLVRYYNDDQTTKQFYREVFEDTLLSKKLKKVELLEATRILANGLEDPNNLLERYAPLLDVILADVENSDEFESTMEKQLEKLRDDDLQDSLKETFVEDMLKKALENNYFMSMEELLTLPENFSHLISPVSDGGLSAVADELSALRGENESSIKNRILNGVYLTNLRHAVAITKAWVGIAAVNITGLSMAQKALLTIDPARVAALPESDRKFLKDAKILLKHNTYDGRSSFSGTKNQSGEYISDRLSGYATAIVDVVKDPFILKIVKSDLAIGTFMLLERFGVENVPFFMNQPIIAEYLTMLDGMGKTTLFGEDLINTIKNRFGSTEELLASTTMINEASFKDNIEKYYSGKDLTDAENAEQQFILDEFLKYAKIAEYAFEITQGTNYDTASYKGGDAMFRKQFITEKALSTNIFVGVKKMMENTFLGAEAELLDSATNATGEVFKLEKPEFAAYTDQVLAPYAFNKYLSGDDYSKIANKIKLSFLDYIIQTRSGLNNQIKGLFNGGTTGIDSQLAKARNQYPNLQILKDLETVESKLEDGTRSVKLKINLRGDAYLENLYTGYMRELKNNPGTRDLYYNLVNVAILQGMYKSPISIGNIIPVEDFSAQIKPIIDALQADLSLETFYKSGMFQRNNFKDDSIVKTIEPKFRVTRYTAAGEAEGYYSTSYFPGSEKTGINEGGLGVLTLSEKYSYIGTRYNFVKFPRIVEQTKAGKATGRYIDVVTGESITGYEMGQRSKRGDMSGKQLFGYQKVTNLDGSPFIIYEDGDRKHVYKLVNLYGDGQLVSEYREYGTPSQLKNNTFPVKQELADEDVINYFQSPNNANITIANTITDVPTITDVATVPTIETRDSLDEKMTAYVNSLVPNYIKTYDDKVRLLSELGSMFLLSRVDDMSNAQLLKSFTGVEKMLKDLTPAEQKEETTETLDNMIANAIIEKLAQDGLSGEDIYNNLFKNIKPQTQPVVNSSNKINIYAGTGENAELSNFAVRPFTDRNGVRFNTVEGAFQAAKLYSSPLYFFPDFGGPRDSFFEMQEKFQNATGAEAKALGRQVKGLDTKKWDSESSRVMKDLLKASFEQNPEALNKLLATGNAELTHTQDNTKWAKEFPKLLMEIRSELSTQPVVDMGRQVDIESGLGLTKENFENPEGYDEFLAEQSKLENKIAKLEQRIENGVAGPDDYDDLETYQNELKKLLNSNYVALVEKAEPVGNILESRKTPIDYTAGQVKALNDVKALIDSGKEGYYLLAGYAGTGKTTIAENIVKYAAANGKRPYVIAPTNKAVKVLNDKLVATGANVQAATIHRTIYGEPDPMTGEWIPKSTIENGLILVDESSMISKEVMADLLALTKDKNNVIVFMGDRFQLEPVGDDSGLFKGDVVEVNNSQSELTEVKRQALDSNVLKIATITRTEGKPYVPSVSIEDFKVVESKSQFVSAFKKAIKDGENAVAIVATNNERITMNDAARMEKFGAGRKVLNNGETLIAIANSSTLSNSEIFTADNIEGEPTKYTIPLKNKNKMQDYDMYMSTVARTGRVPMTVLHFPNVDKASVYHAEILKSVRENNRDLYNQLNDAGHIIQTKTGLKLSPNVVISTYGYAITAHKSQGSQWDKVFVNQNYNADTWNPARWYYTAITRSAKEVIILPSQYNVRLTPQAIENKINGVVVENATSPKVKKVLFTVVKAKEQKKFRNKPLVFVDTIPTTKDSIVAMQNNRQTGVITISEMAMRQKFASKAWTKPVTQKDGSKATPLREKEFGTFNEFLTFALIHEVKHDTILKQEGETTGAYEDRINQAALTDLRSNYGLPNSNQIAPEGLPSINDNNINNCG